MPVHILQGVHLGCVYVCLSAGVDRVGEKDREAEKGRHGRASVAWP